MSFDIIRSQNNLILIGVVAGFALGLSVGVIVTGWLK